MALTSEEEEKKEREAREEEYKKEREAREEEYKKEREAREEEYKKEVIEKKYFYSKKNSRIRPITTFVIMPILFIIFFIYLPSFFSINSIWNTLRLLIIMILIILLIGALYGNITEELYDRFSFWLFDHKPLVDQYFLKNWAPENALTELSCIQKIGYFTIPIVILLTVIYEIGTDFSDLSSQFFDAYLDKLRDVNLILILFNYPIMAFFIFTFSTSFRFYFARITFMVAQNKKIEFDKMKYYVRGVKEYNKFLARNLHFQLDESKIFSKLLSTNSINDINEDELIKSFNYLNKLEPVRYFTKISANGELLLPLNRGQQLKEWIEFAVTLFPIASLLLIWIFPALKSILSDSG